MNTQLTHDPQVMNTQLGHDPQAVNIELSHDPQAVNTQLAHDSQVVNTQLEHLIEYEYFLGLLLTICLPLHLLLRTIMTPFLFCRGGEDNSSLWPRGQSHPIGNVIYVKMGIEQ